MIMSTVGTGFLRFLLVLKPGIYVPFRHDSGDRMLINELLRRLLQKDDEIIECLHYSLQADTVCKVDYDRYLILPELIQIIVLQTLALAISHPLPPLVFSWFFLSQFFIYLKLFFLIIQVFKGINYFSKNVATLIYTRHIYPRDSLFLLKPRKLPLGVPP